MATRLFGTASCGTPIHEVEIGRDGGLRATIMEWGAVVRDMTFPGRAGPQRVVLGLTGVSDYETRSPHMGAIAGRYANRIAAGRFTLDGVNYELPRNEGGRNALHGGPAAFGKRPWRIAAHDADSVTLVVHSPDGDGGYPGALTAICRYSVVDGGALRVELTATTDAPTIVNLCQHSYFNLDGGASILDHSLEVSAGFYTPVAEDLIPTGEIRAVDGTAFDFRTSRPIRFPGAGGGAFRYDHNFVLNRATPHPALKGVHKAAEMVSPRSGIAMTVWTSEPGVQVYDGHKVEVAAPTIAGTAYGANAGICFEPQRFPDTPNRPHFGNAVLRPGEVYRQTTEYAFALR